MFEDEMWAYLDVMDKNLLYLYASKLTKKGQNQHFYVSSATGNAEYDKVIDAENQRKSAFYLIWFVYRWVLGCETLEQTKPYANEETLKKYKLNTYFLKNASKKSWQIYIGVYGVNEVYLYDCEKGDLDIVLEILYNRYDLLEQLECYVRKKQEVLRKGFARSKRVLDETVALMQKSPKCAPVLVRYYERHPEAKPKKGEKLL